MNLYRADLHIHTVLSPCGDLDMSPVNIVRKAYAEKLNIIGITDHNSTLHAPLVEKLAAEFGIMVLKGAEITTREEVHSLCFFELDEQLIEFQSYIESKMTGIKNDVRKFGHQLVVDKDELILREIEELLIAALDVSISELEKKVHSLDGLFIPAHVNRQKFSLISQLGFVPTDMNEDALELSSHIRLDKFLAENTYLSKKRYIQSSDAHYIEDIGKVYTTMRMEHLSFSEFKLALKAEQGRKIECK